MHKLVNVTESTHMHALAQEMAEAVLSAYPNIVRQVHIQLKMPRALLLADSASVDLWRGINIEEKEDVIEIKNLALAAVIGLNACERLEKQKLLISLEFVRSREAYNYKTICKSVEELVNKSEFKTIELLALTIAKCCIVDCCVSKVCVSLDNYLQATVIVDKPNAVMFAECASVMVTRSEKDYPSTALESRLLTPESHVAYIAIGSNIGNRASFIESSIAMLNSHGCVLLDSSFMYESDPMYVIDQPEFLNCIVKVHTLESPNNLLALLQQIESDLGRKSLGTREVNGPRPIDLDILFYDKIVMNEPNLIIPHPRIQERLFVLKPLVEYYLFSFYS